MEKIYEVEFLNYTNSMRDTASCNSNEYLNIDNKYIDIPKDGSLLVKESELEFYKNYGNGYRSITYVGELAESDENDCTPVSLSKCWIPTRIRKPKNSEYDWVLIQVRDKDSGSLRLPCIANYSESKDDWQVGLLGWLKGNPEGNFEVIAWMPLPDHYREKE